MADPMQLPYNYPEEFADISKKSIEKQKDTTSISDNFNTIMSSTSVQEIQDKGTTMMGNYLLTPNLLKKAQSDNSLKTNMYREFKNSQKKITQDVDKPIVPISTADYKGIDESLFDGYDKSSEEFKKFIDSVEDRQLVAKVFGDKSSIPVKGRQIIVNSFKTGNFYDELSRMAKSIPGDVLRLPTLAYMAYAAGRSAVYSQANNEEEGAFNNKFSQLMQDTPNLQSWNNMLNKSVVTKDMATRLNGWYKEKYIEAHGEKQYNDDHKVPMVEVIDGGIVPKVDENGEYQYRIKELDANIANDLLDLSYGKLGGTAKAGMFFLTMLPFTSGARVIRTAGDINLLNKFENLRKTDNRYKGLDNTQLLTQWRKDRSVADGAFRKLWQTATLTSDKTSLRDAGSISQHVNIIHRYDVDIANLNDKITNAGDVLNTKEKALAMLNSSVTKGKTLNVTEQANKADLTKSILEVKKQLKIDQGLLNVNKKSRRTYSLKNGNGRYVNPYLVSTVADDVIISASMGYAPQLFGWVAEETADIDLNSAVDTRWQEMLIGLTAPFVAPRAAALSVRGMAGLADMLSTGGITETAKLLEGTNFMGILNPGILLTNDEAKFKKVLTAYNISVGKQGAAATPTVDEIQSFKLMSRIYRNMQPQYREGSFQALLKYNQTMQNFESQMKKLGMGDEVIDKNMQTLNLSMAEVTGLAPLIAYSRSVGSSFTSTDAVNNVDKLAAIAFASEDKLNGIDILLDTLKQSVKKESGIDLDGNGELQDMFNFMSTMVSSQRNQLTKQKSMLQEQLDTFSNNVGMKEVDSDTIDKIVSLNSLLGGRVLNIKERAIEVNNTYNKLLDGVNKQVDEIKLFSGEMTEKALQLQVRRVADVMFDLEIGRRRALGSKFYKDVDKYASDNNIKVDMTELITTYLEKSVEYSGKPLTKVFGRGSDFFNSLGAPIQKTFNSMASNALNKTYSRQDVNELKKTYEFMEILPQNSTDLELALYMKQTQMSKIKNGTLDPAKATMVDFFDGTTKEAEDVMRYFRNKALQLAKNTNSTKIPEEITNLHISVIDDLFLKADPSGVLLDMQRKARKNYSEVVGEVSDTSGQYVPDVLFARQNKIGIIRKDRKNVIKEREGNYEYKNGRGTFKNINNKSPEAPFYNIANIAEKLLFTKSSGDTDDLLQQIVNERDRLFKFLGAKKQTDANGDVQFGFDLSQPRQQKVMELAESLMNTVVSHRLGHAVYDEAGKINSIVKGANGKKLENLDNINPENYNFANAINLIQMENRLTVPVINKNGVTEQRKFFNATAVKGFAVDIVEHMRVSQKARDEFVRLKTEILDTKGALNIEAKGILDEQNVSINALETITKYTKKPKQFFEENFLNATPKSINDLIQDLVAKGKAMETPVNEATIRKSLKYMYLKGVLETANVQKSIDVLDTKKVGKYSDLTPAAREEITDIQSFVNVVMDDNNRDVMQAIMGVDSDHIGFLRDMANWITYAGGNTRGFAARTDTKGLTIDSIFSRVFNIARGMVSPLYVGTEIATRLLLEKNQSLLTVALRDKQASKILARMIKDPEGVTDLEIKTLGQRVKVYVTMEVLANRKSGIPTLNEFVGLDEEEKVLVDTKKNLQDVKLQKGYIEQGVN